MCQTKKDLGRHLGIYHSTIIILFNGLLMITARLISLFLFMIINIREENVDFKEV